MRGYRADVPRRRPAGWPNGPGGCGLAERTGRLRPGLDADLLMVAGNPASDVAALAGVRVVVSRGRELPAVG